MRYRGASSSAYDHLWSRTRLNKSATAPPPTGHRSPGERWVPFTVQSNPGKDHYFVRWHFGVTLVASAAEIGRPCHSRTAAMTCSRHANFCGWRRANCSTPS
eukprot:352342-Chlamydomonas_euryale.AAC.1